MRWDGARPLVLALLVSGCGGGEEDSQTRAGGGGTAGAGAASPADGGGFPGGSGGSGALGGASAGGGSAGAGGSSAEPAGGLAESAPIVGCAEAERPARSLGSSAQETCEAKASARCWFVSPSGDDAASGSFDAPLLRPQTAAKKAAPGDIIYLRGGVYGPEQASAVGVPQWDNPSGGVTKRALEIDHVVLPSWAGGDDYAIASGTAEAPITVKSFPGERACLKNTGGIGVGGLSQPVAHWLFERLTLQGDAVVVRGGAKGADGSAVNEPHHITIRYSEIFDHAAPALDNTGLVKVDRGDWGGPHDIFVEHDLLHDLSVVEDGATLDWQNTTDAIHFAAVTTLSRENYFGFVGGGTGALTIRGNVIYRTPQAFFFKNPMQGPIEIADNRIREVRMLGDLGAANVHMIGNLVVGVGVGWFKTGNEDAYGDGTETINGHDARIEFNTFVGLNELLGLRRGTGHTIERNVFFGMKHSATGANWDTPAYILVSEHAAEPLDTKASTLHQIVSNDNCFITPAAGFQFLARRIRPENAGGDWHLDHWDFSAQKTLFGLDASSEFYIGGNADEVFVSPSTDDYALKDPARCAGKGYLARP